MNVFLATIMDRAGIQKILMRNTAFGHKAVDWVITGELFQGLQ